MNKRIYRVGQSDREVIDNDTTEVDITKMTITPMSGFPHYGNVMNDYLMNKGFIVGFRKRCLMNREGMFPLNLSGEAMDIKLNSLILAASSDMLDSKPAKKK